MSLRKAFSRNPRQVATNVEVIVEALRQVVVEPGTALSSTEAVDEALFNILCRKIAHTFRCRRSRGRSKRCKNASLGMGEDISILDPTCHWTARCSSSRRSSCAFAATMMVDRLIATAPRLMGRSNPQWTKRPPATGMASRL
jgi:hypothetical protein